MGIKLETHLNRLRKLDASKPGQDFVAAGIDPNVSCAFTVQSGESVADLMNRIHVQVVKETGGHLIDEKDVVLDIDCTGYYGDVEGEMIARVNYPKTTQQLQKEIDAEIRRVEKAIHRRDNPSPTQQKRMQKQQQRQQALSKLTDQERKILGV